MNRIVLSVAAVGALVGSAHGAMFDFEDQVITTLPDGTRTGGHAELLMADGGVNLSVTRFGGDDFDVFDNDTFISFGPVFRPPAAWGQKSLDPFIDAQGFGGVGFVLAFDQPVENFQIDYGDFGDDADVIEVELYTDATLASLVSSDSVTMTGNSTFEFTSGTIAVSGAFRVAIIRGGSAPFPHSVFFDNLSVTIVPSVPTSLGICLALPAALRRRR